MKIHTWLETIKEGFGKFSAAFEEVGAGGLLTVIRR
jgi:hypothetical protein